MIGLSFENLLQLTFAVVIGLVFLYRLWVGQQKTYSTLRSAFRAIFAVILLATTVSAALMFGLTTWILGVIALSLLVISPVLKVLRKISPKGFAK
jgi:predicted membrane metal-binding protein